MTALVGTLKDTGIAVSRACTLVGIARSSYYRLERGYAHYVPVENPIPHKQRSQPAALTESEQYDVIAALEDERYADCSVVQTYWRAFDAAAIDCSERTFYRYAAAHGLVGDRRRRKHAQHPTPRNKPIVHAGEVGQLWSWDVTELRGPRTQDRYKLYLVIDVFSRYPVGWRIEYTEDTTKAVEMFARAITEHGVPNGVHSDNGAIMRAHAMVDALHENNIVTTYSRPRVSDDNPFSESLFKTIKYDLNCPEIFDHIEHARQWTTHFLNRYATEHRHSNLGRHTPRQVHTGTAATTAHRRQQILDRAYTRNPHRFHTRPTAPALPRPTGINTNLSQAG